MQPGKGLLKLNTVTYLDQLLTLAGACDAALGLTPMTAGQGLLASLITRAHFAAGFDARVPERTHLPTLLSARRARPAAALTAASMPGCTCAHAWFRAGFIMDEFRVMADLLAGVSAGSTEIAPVTKTDSNNFDAIFRNGHRPRLEKNGVRQDLQCDEST